MNENYERAIALAERLKTEGWVIHSINVDKRELTITKYYASLRVWFSVESEYRVKISIQDTIKAVTGEAVDRNAALEELIEAAESTLKEGGEQ